jgi:nicotinamidase-related amidase
MERSAVLIIDVQEGLFRTDPPPFEAGEVVERINGLIRRARAAGAPVFLIQQDGVPGDDSLRPFSPGWELCSGLEREDGDLILRKTTCDAFYRTGLEEQLRGLGVELLVIAGYATEFCVDATLRNALSRDFAVTVAADSHTTNDNPVLKAAAIRDHHNWAWANCISCRPVSVQTADEITWR